MLSQAERPARPTPPVARAGLLLLLGALAFLPAASTDMYLPSLPDIATEFDAPSGAVQLTISAVMIGGALSQLVVGPLSDRLGRRRPALIGLAAFAAVAALCALTASITQLVSLRLLQGIVGSAASITGTAIVGDLYRGAEAARVLSRLWVAVAVAPIAAPLLGTVVAGAWGWRGVFWVLSGLALALLLWCLRSLPETVRATAATTATTRARGYGVLLRDRHFVAIACVPGLTFAVLMSYVTGSPFVLQEEYGLTSEQYALVFGAGATSMIVGSQLNAALVRRLGPVRLLRVGLPGVAVSAGALVVLTATGVGGVVGLLVPLWFAIGLVSMVMSNATAVAISRVPGRAGSAAAVVGCVQGLLGGTVSPLVGLLGGGGVAMTGVMLGAALAALTVLALGTSAYRRGGADRLLEPGVTTPEVAPQP